MSFNINSCLCTVVIKQADVVGRPVRSFIERRSSHVQCICICISISVSSNINTQALTETNAYRKGQRLERLPFALIALISI